MRQFNEGGKCKCGGCGRTFSSLSTFDAHQRTIDVPPYVECLDPYTVVKKDGTPRLRLVGGVWKSAQVNERWAS